MTKPRVWVRTEQTATHRERLRGAHARAVQLLCAACTYACTHVHAHIRASESAQECEGSGAGSASAECVSLPMFLRLYSFSPNFFFFLKKKGSPYNQAY